ncbi:uncharacterized protein [Diadema antillarum]|uniref:uncharacterized protein n=1 Tax=Diadema antillarum TaxID=105358 RepID=UPI003A8A40F5
MGAFFNACVDPEDVPEDHESQRRSSFGSLSAVDEVVRNLLLKPNDISRCQVNPLTHRGKQIQLAKMLLLVLVPITALAILAVEDLRIIAYTNSVDIEIRNVIQFSRNIGLLLSRLQRERDMTALYVSVIAPNSTAFLTETYPLTDKALDELQEWPVETSILNELPFFREKMDFKENLEAHRTQLHHANTTVYREIEFYTDMLQIFIDWLYESVGNSQGHGSWQILVAYQLLIVSNVDTGIERTLGTVFYTLGGFERHEDYVWYMEKYNVGTWNHEAAKRYAPLIQEFYQEQVDNIADFANFTHTITKMRKEILENAVATTVSNFREATLWFDSMTVYINILEKVHKLLADEILQILEKELEDDTENIAVSIFLVVVVIIMCPLTLRAIWSLTTVLQNYALTLASQTKEFNKEKKRSNYLLNLMLPPSVASKLMNTEEVNGELFESATVMFADIAGFSQLCARSEPMEVVEMLNGLYVLFDSRIEQYDVYKVETVRETYMLASGVPNRHNRHVGEIATVTVDLLHHVNSLEVPHKPHVKIRVRFGIHTGPLVAGVVGLKMPRYCLFGDTVNTASRMQTTGLPGRIHVSHPTYMGLLEYGGFSLVKRGEIEIKGKGRMYTYWLMGRDNFEMFAIDNSARDHMGIQEHRYAHMYDQMYTGRVQFAGPNQSQSPTFI